MAALIQPTIYGEPGLQVILSGNHQLSLDHTVEQRSNLTLIVLDSGGFPTEAAVLLGHFPPPDEHAFTNYVESVDGRVIYLIPHCLLTVWEWRDGESHLGGIVYIDTDTAASVLTRIAPSFFDTTMHRFFTCGCSIISVFLWAWRYLACSRLFFNASPAF